MGNIASIVEDAERKRRVYHPPDFRHTVKFRYDEVYVPATWTRDRAKVERRRKRWAKKGFHNARAYNFATSRPMFDPLAQISWECVDILGEGGFGIVGLWQQLDHNGGVIDSVAIKEVDNDPNCTVVHFRGYSIPMEAAALVELRHSPYSLQLRDLKQYEAKNGAWRFYSEYAEHGTVQGMIKLYREWNAVKPKADHYKIDEAFIWYCFYAFARTLCEMEDAEFKDMHKSEQPPGKPRYLLHLDAKSENVLLGRPHDGRYIERYPVVKVADPGLAVFTSLQDPNNSYELKYRGTLVWSPPEQFRSNSFCRDWRTDIFGNSARPYTMAHSVWQFAAVIFGMITLDVDNRLLFKLMTDLMKNERQAHNCSYRLVQWDRSVAATYSKRLLELVDDCLRLEPRKRPTPRKLLKETKIGMYEEAIRQQSRGRRKAPKVYFGPRDQAWAAMEADARQR